MKLREIIENLSWLRPEMVLVGFVMLVILVDIIPRGRKWMVTVAGVGGLLLALAAVISYLAAYPAVPKLLLPAGQSEAPLAIFGGAFAVDHFSLFFKAAFLGAALIVAIFSIPTVRSWSTGKGEFFALLLACAFGMLLMAGANDLLMMYLALEFVSITSYILAGFLRKNRKSSEASLKYIIYGAAASGFMIYGMTYLYGVTGTLNVGELGAVLAQSNVPPMMTLITSVLIMVGFGYKIAAAPFHMWCPDVYEGAPTPVTAFFSVGPKAAGLAMLARFLWSVYPAGTTDLEAAGPFEWRLVLAVLAVLTMAVGNLGALPQQNLKRLLAYSSIAHAGYLLIAFVVFTPEALSALLFYVVVYVVMNLGAFLVVLVLEERYGIETVDGCRGIGWKAPMLGGLMTLFLFSLTGIPPTAGFMGKFLVFAAVIEHGLAQGTSLPIILVVIAVVFTVISLFYYMRILAAMFLRPPAEGVKPARTGVVATAMLWILAIGTLWFFFAWGHLEALTRGAAGSILPPV